MEVCWQVRGGCVPNFHVHRVSVVVHRKVGCRQVKTFKTRRGHRARRHDIRAKLHAMIALLVFVASIPEVVVTVVALLVAVSLVVLHLLSTAAWPRLMVPIVILMPAAMAQKISDNGCSRKFKRVQKKKR